MGLKPGYKQTALGVIPEEWEVEKIGDLIEKQFILGHLDGNHGELYPRSHEFKPYGVPYVGANDFEEGNVTFERCKFLSDERAAKFRKGVARDGDVLFAHNATVGPVALLRTDVPFVILSTTATYFRCNPEKLSNSYLRGALQAQYFVKQYQAVMAQSTRFQVPITAQRKLSLVIAPLPEQRAIAEALSNVDALIGALERLIGKKRDLKQAAMQQLLTGQTRLPGFHGEWEVKRLGDIIHLIPSGIYGEEKPRDGLIAASVATTAHIDADDTWNDKEMPVRYFTAEKLRDYATSKGDMIVVKSSGSAASIQSGKIGFIDTQREKQFVFSNFLMLLRPIAILPSFLYFYLSSHNVKKLLPTLVEASTYPNIRLGDYLALEIPVPSLAEQTAIAEVLTDMDAEIAVLEQRREKTRALKQAMMQELLTGRKRLVPVNATKGMSEAEGQMP
jgi:type I restriction enzyme S subunit